MNEWILKTTPLKLKSLSKNIEKTKNDSKLWYYKKINTPTNQPTNKEKTMFFFK